MLHLAILLFTALGHRTGSPALERAVEMFVSGPLRRAFWLGAVGCGCALPLALIAWRGAGGPGSLLAALLALAGAYCWDRVWVRAGQAVPLS